MNNPRLENIPMNNTFDDAERNKLIKKVLELGKRLNRKPKKRDDNSLYFASRQIFGSWNNLMKASGYDVQFYQKIKSPKFTSHFPYFLGLLATDGHIYYNKKTKQSKVAIYTSYPEEREFIIKLIQKMFGYNAYFSAKMASYNKKPNYEIRICSNKLAEILNKEWDIPFGAKSSIVRVPKKIMGGSNYSKQLFLKGVIDGDGSITKWGIKIASGSIWFLNDLKKLLSDLGIHSGGLIIERPTTYTIRINKKSDLLKFKDIYSRGLSYPRKKESAIRFIRQENPNEILIHVHVHNPSKEIINSKEFIKKSDTGDTAINILFKIDTELMKERQIMDRFMTEVSKDGLATYGQKEVEKAIEERRVSILIISEDIPWLYLSIFGLLL